jgi:nitrogen fixation/metabolism regulation signal transduction histidine kinase
VETIPARAEAKSDLKKPILQLLEDAHEEILHTDRPIDQNFMHAFKRFASLQARAASAAERQTLWVIILTCVLIVLTLVLVMIELRVFSNA